MVMVDRFFERPTVQPETLAMLARRSGQFNLGGHQRVRVREEETQPELLRDLLARRYRHDELERQIATAYGKGLEAFWGDIDSVLVAHFQQSNGTHG